MKDNRLFTSESVAEGHPDKLCDQVADAILDHCLALDPMAHVAVECFVSTQFLLIGGEVSFSKKVIEPDYKAIALKAIERIGYTDPELGFSVGQIEVKNLIKPQSPDINQGVNRSLDFKEIGAGDQGLMFGYASTETEGYMPLAIVVAHKLVRVASQLRKQGKFPDARPDMKSQVTIDYSGAKPRAHTVLMSIQHQPKTNLESFTTFVRETIMKPVVQSFGLNTDFEVLVNPSGRFEIGGPKGDTGLTGRKIIVDTYGGYGRHGGGSFSGKDATKVDRSGAYMMRYIAKNLVAAGVAERLEIQVSYAIGKPLPISISLFTFGTLRKGLADEQVLHAVRTLFDLRPGVIIETFKLNRPSFKYQDLAAYGHFGRPDLNLPWEKLDKVAQIKALLKI